MAHLFVGMDDYVPGAAGGLDDGENLNYRTATCGRAEWASYPVWGRDPYPYRGDTGDAGDGVARSVPGHEWPVIVEDGRPVQRNPACLVRL